MDGDRLLGHAFPPVKMGVHMFAYLKLGSSESIPSTARAYLKINQGREKKSFCRMD